MLLVHPGVQLLLHAPPTMPLRLLPGHKMVPLSGLQDTAILGGLLNSNRSRPHFTLHSSRKGAPNWFLCQESISNFDQGPRNLVLSFSLELSKLKQ